MWKGLVLFAFAYLLSVMPAAADPNLSICFWPKGICETCDRFIGWDKDPDKDNLSETEKKELADCVKLYKEKALNMYETFSEAYKNSTLENLNNTSPLKQKSTRAFKTLMEENKFLLLATPKEIILYHAAKRLQADQELMDNWEMYECQRIVGEKYRDSNFKGSGVFDEYMREFSTCRCLHKDPKERQIFLNGFQCPEGSQETKPQYDQPSKIID